MKFECGDLERALASPDLMPEAREHVKTCAVCRREYRLWTDISSTAKELRENWETPLLWESIRKALEAEPKLSAPRWRGWKTWAIAATVLLTALVVPLEIREYHRGGAPGAEKRPAKSVREPAPESPDFLTEQALLEVQKNEAAYRQSIARLSRLAAAKLENANSPALVNTREKLLLLDSAIDETRTNVGINRFNVSLQNTLADLYRQKQETLQELLTRDQNN